MTLDTFLRWLNDNGVKLLDGVAIVGDRDGGMCVISSGKNLIIHPQTLATIPKTSILSVRSCALAQHVVWHPYGHGATLALSLALYSELLRKVESRWYGYLQSIPADTVPIARLWGHKHVFHDDQDAMDAALWCCGTEVQRELQNDDGVALIEEIDRYYVSEVHALLTSMGFEPSLAGFLHAYSLVCSRAFLVDAYHGLSMVPLADAFNHSQENHVQLASEYDVCPACGSLSECLHDRDDMPTELSDGNSTSLSSMDPTDTVDMVTVRSVPPGVEVLNTYGSTLGNASLLARYGFILEGGEIDTVTFGWKGSGLIINYGQGIFRDVYRETGQRIGEVVSDSALIYSPGVGAEPSPLLSVNGDGQISVALFLWAVVESLPLEPARGSLDVISEAAFKVSLELAKTETLRHGGEDTCFAAEDDQLAGESVIRVLIKAVDTICRLCRMRAAQIGTEHYRGASSEVLGDILDNLPPERAKTKLALKYVLGERAILEACAAGWEDLRDYVTATCNLDWNGAQDKGLG